MAPVAVAFLLATCPDAALRNGAEALALAEPIARAFPNDVAALDTLAAAQAELGRFDEAVATIPLRGHLTEGPYPDDTL